MDQEVTSQATVRVGYNSNIVSENRALGLNQLGLSGSAAYFHKSGFFADATGYWSSEYEPGYFLTVASAGYMSPTLRNWTVMGEYSRFFYELGDNEVVIPYKNSFTATSFYQSKRLSFRFDYSLFTGEKTGHRFTPSFSYQWQRKKIGRFDKLTISPFLSAMFGIEKTITYVPRFRNRIEFLFLVRRGIDPYYEDVNHPFGLMNVGFTLPISLQWKQWALNLGYTFNIPLKLPGEVSNLQPGGYLTANIARYFEWGRPLQ